MAINYLRRVQALRQNQGQSDVERGLASGQAIGKLLGGLSEAIKSSQKDQAANALMTAQNIANQPGAGQTQDLGNLPSDGSSDGSGGVASDDQLPQAMAATRLSSSSQPAQDLGQLPTPSPMTPSATGAQLPVPDPSVSDDQLNQAITAARLGSGPTVGSVVPGGPQPNAAPAGAQPVSGGSSDNWNLSQFSGGTSTGEGTFPGGTGTVGGLIGTGGTAALTLQQEVAKQKLAQQNANLSQQRGALDLADRRAEIAGTGRFATDAALKRAQLLEAQRKATNPTTKPVDLEKNPPSATNLDTEPVVSQGQLTQTVDGDYGSGTYGGLMRTINEPETIPDPKGNIDPATGKVAQIPNPDGPQFNADKSSITLGPKSKRVTMTLAHAQILAKQQNSVNLKKGLPLIAVPGEDQSLGATPDKPYPVNNALDAKSRPIGSWVRLPDKRIAQVGK